MCVCTILHSDIIAFHLTYHLSSVKCSAIIAEIILNRRRPHLMCKKKRDAMTHHISIIRLLREIERAREMLCI